MVKRKDTALHNITYLIKKITLIILSLCFIILLFSSIYEQSLIEKNDANQGKLILKNLANKKQLSTLDGEWLFYPYQLKTTNFDNCERIKVPGILSKIFNTKESKDKRFGYGTYRLSLTVDTEAEYGMKIGFLSSAYKVYIDGKILCENGRIATETKEEIASWTPRLIFFHADQGEHEIIIQVSNYTCNAGGITTSILFGKQDILFDFEIINTIKHALLLGIIIGIGFYLIMFNLSIRNNQLSNCLGVLCISSFLLEIVLDGGTIFYLFNSITVELATRIEYIAYIGQIIGMMCFVYEMFKEFYSKKVFQIFIYIDFAYLILLVFTSTTGLIFQDSILIAILVSNSLISLIITIKARRKYRKRATVFILGGAMMYFFGLLQLLNLRHFIDVKASIQNDFYAIGLILFMLCLSYLLFNDIEMTFQRSKEAKKMEIAFLQAQIAPHFFFNVINNIYYMMDTEPAKAKKLLLNFSDFLRVKHKFDYRKNVYYTIREEIDLVRSFIEMENIRLNNQILLKIDVQEELLDTYILPLLIQPLAENVIKHGYYGKPIELRIKIVSKDNIVSYVIQDTGKGMGQDRIYEIYHGNNESKGIGLSNINYRLEDCYQTRLSIESTLHVGTKISFNLPMKQEGKLII